MEVCLLSLNKIILLILTVWSCQLLAADQAALAGDAKAQELFIAILEARLERASDKQARRSPPYKVMDAISKLGNEGEAANHFLVALLDYYLGEMPTSTLEDTLTKRGSSVRTLLEERRGQSLSCIKKYRQICLDSVEERNPIIDSILQELMRINRGKKGTD
jgi:hypothetical protein